MKITLFMAMSANGLIARPSGSEDFLSHTGWIEFVRLARKNGCFVVGRRTYEAVRAWDENFSSVPVPCIVVSRHMRAADPGVILVRSPKDAVRAARLLGARGLLLTGGSEMNAAFLQAGFVDEVVLDVDPVVVGRGIPVFAPAGFEQRLRLRSARRIGGIVQLRYAVRA